MWGLNSTARPKGAKPTKPKYTVLHPYLAFTCLYYLDIDTYALLYLDDEPTSRLPHRASVAIRYPSIYRSSSKHHRQRNVRQVSQLHHQTRHLSGPYAASVPAPPSNLQHRATSVLYQRRIQMCKRSSPGHIIIADRRRA